MPSTIGGLDVQSESVKAAIAKKGGELTYADSIGFWSLRKDKLVQATLQIEHFGPSARLGDPKFAASVAQSITMGATAPTRIGDYDVYLQQGQTVNLAIWFEGAYFFELAVRPTYAQPRTLLESAVAVKA